MSKAEKQLISLMVAGALVIGVLIAQIFQNPDKVKASVDNDSSGYQSTSTPKAVNYAAGTAQLKTGNGIFGSMIFSGAPKGARVTFYDATTTNVNLRTGNRATSSIIIAEFDAGQATSTTYVFDTQFSVGLLMETSGNPSTSTPTWK